MIHCRACFYLKTDGCPPTFREFKASSKTVALTYAKRLAKNEDMRFISLTVIPQAQ